MKWTHTHNVVKIKLKEGWGVSLIYDMKKEGAKDRAVRPLILIYVKITYLEE